MKTRGTCMKCREYRDLYPQGVSYAGLCGECAKQTIITEKLAQRKSDEDVIHRLTILLEQNQLEKADQLIREEGSDETERIYEMARLNNLIKPSLRALEIRLRKDEGFFDDEKAAVLAKWGENILVQARAGSGKTTLIALKVQQLIELYSLMPEEILVLTFNRKASEEFRTRINEYCMRTVVDKSNSLTFHSLAHKIVNPKEELIFNDTNEGAEFVQGKQTDFVGGVYEAVRDEDRGVIEHLVYSFFKSVAQEKLPSEFKNDTDYYTYRKNLQYTALGGERVKSNAEKFIADFLFEHDLKCYGEKIVYKYEYSLAAGKRRYHPDFSFWRINSLETTVPLAIFEHFGVTKANHAAPEYMTQKEEAQYLEDRNWKMNFCKEQNIAYIETSVDDVRRFDEACRPYFETIIKERLAQKGITAHKIPNRDVVKKMLSAKGNLERLTTQLTQFINRAKKQLITADDLRELLISGENTLDSKNKSFLKLARRIFSRYEQELVAAGKIDFDDLITRAADEVEKTSGQCCIDVLGTEKEMRTIKYVLIDEYQDFSKPFFRLVNALKKCNPKLQLFCVGDDWQAINGFAGSHLDFFHSFENQFTPAVRAFLLTNYRSNTSIVRHANSIMEGRGKPSKPHATKNAGAVYLDMLLHVEWRKTPEQNGAYVADEMFRTMAHDLCAKNGRELDLSRYLKSVHKITQERAGRSICLLFRTNTICGVKIKKIAESVSKSCHTTINAETTHAFKGKEADIIIMDANQRSYPKLHPDNDLLEILGVTTASILEEERRLFYVAVTRAKEELFILHNDENFTDFISKRRWTYESFFK